MSTQIAAPMAQNMELALIGGDLAKLTPEQRLSYYNQVCSSMGLNPLTKPFAYITLNGKMVLYALKDCTEQLRTIHNVSLVITAREMHDDVYVVTAKAVRVDGRQDESTGAVTVGGLKGEAKANAMMKAETKAKRRVTLSICGLGMLDESEAESIPGDHNGTREAQLQVAAQRIEELRSSNPQSRLGSGETTTTVATDVAGGETVARQSTGTSREIPPAPALGSDVQRITEAAAMLETPPQAAVVVEVQAPRPSKDEKAFLKLPPDMQAMVKKFQAIKGDLRKVSESDETYYTILGAHGYEKSTEIRTIEEGRTIYAEMKEVLKTELGKVLTK